jgi:hypothetical protein
MFGVQPEAMTSKSGSQHPVNSLFVSPLFHHNCGRQYYTYHQLLELTVFSQLKINKPFVNNQIVP